MLNDALSPRLRESPLPATIHRFENPEALAQGFVEQLIQWYDQHCEANPERPLTVSLSGGSTPKRMFEILAESYGDRDWTQISFFWGDERCVPPEDADSNFGVAKRLFLEPAQVPEENIHRVLGEIDPEQARRQYEAEIKQHVNRNESGVPVFDVMLLGMGDDGHTASIFPDRLDLLTEDAWCAVALHPESGQPRVTLTGSLIESADRVCFLIAGQNKADVLATILKGKAGREKFPTSHFVDSCDAQMFVDAAAGAQLNV